MPGIAILVLSLIAWRYLLGRLGVARRSMRFLKRAARFGLYGGAIVGAIVGLTMYDAAGAGGGWVLLWSLGIAIWGAILPFFISALVISIIHARSYSRQRARLRRLATGDDSEFGCIRLPHQEALVDAIDHLTETMTIKLVPIGARPAQPAGFAGDWADVVEQGAQDQPHLLLPAHALLRREKAADQPGMTPRNPFFTVVIRPEPAPDTSVVVSATSDTDFCDRVLETLRVSR